MLPTKYSTIIRRRYHKQQNIMFTPWHEEEGKSAKTTDNYYFKRKMHKKRTSWLLDG